MGWPAARRAGASSEGRVRASTGRLDGEVARTDSRIEAKLAGNLASSSRENMEARRQRQEASPSQPRSLLAVPGVLSPRTRKLVGRVTSLVKPTTKLAAEVRSVVKPTTKLAGEVRSVLATTTKLADKVVSLLARTRKLVGKLRSPRATTAKLAGKVGEPSRDRMMARGDGEKPSDVPGERSVFVSEPSESGKEGSSCASELRNRRGEASDLRSQRSDRSDERSHSPDELRDPVGKPLAIPREDIFVTAIGQTLSVRSFALTSRHDACRRVDEARDVSHEARGVADEGSRRSRDGFVPTSDAIMRSRRVFEAR